MDSLKSLFGIGSSSHEKLSLQDNDLGTFTALNNSESRIIGMALLILWVKRFP
jgi:hypothetical protein